MRYMYVLGECHNNALYNIQFLTVFDEVLFLVKKYHQHTVDILTRVCSLQSCNIDREYFILGETLAH